MNWELAFFAGAAVFVVLNILDVLTTIRFLKDGTGYEANPVMAWAQKLLGRYWWIAKLPFVAIPVLLWMHAPGLPGVVGITIADLGYSYIVWNNYRLG